MVEEGYDSLLIRALGSSPKLRILDYLLDYKLNDFTKKEIIEALGMSKLTFYKYFKDLEELGLVAASRKIGRATLYRVNLGNPMVRMLIEYERQLSLQVAEGEKAKTQKPVPVSARPPSRQPLLSRALAFKRTRKSVVKRLNRTRMPMGL